MWENLKKHTNVCYKQILLLSRSVVSDSATLWTVARQAPLSIGFSRQEYWSGLPSSPPGDLSNPRIEPKSHVSPALAGRFFTTSATWEAYIPVSTFFSPVFQMGL